MHTTPFVEFCFRSEEGRFNSLYPCGRICASVDWPSLVQITTCRQVGTKPLPQPMLAYCRLDSLEQISVKFESELYNFHSRKFIQICRLPKWWPSLYEKVPWWIMYLYNPSGIYRNPNWTVSVTRLRLAINPPGNKSNEILLYTREDHEILCRKTWSGYCSTGTD